MSKTVSKLCLVERDEVPELPELSDELRLGLAEVAGAAREGLLAMSVAVGPRVMAEMMDEAWCSVLLGLCRRLRPGLARPGVLVEGPPPERLGRLFDPPGVMIGSGPRHQTPHHARPYDPPVGVAV